MPETDFFEDLFESKIFQIAEKINRFASKVDVNQDFYDPKEFPWAEKLESYFPEIRKELDEVLKDRKKIPALQDVFPEQDDLARGDDWKVFCLHICGNDLKKNIERCPKTAEALSCIPNMESAFFSILEPQKDIPLHRGMYNGFLRCHLALKVPDPENCGIVVGDSGNEWYEGKTMFFDDCNIHYAWNETDDVRVVLFIDFERPMHFPWNLINKFNIRMIRLFSVVKNFVENARKYQS